MRIEPKWRKKKVVSSRHKKERDLNSSHEKKTTPFCNKNGWGSVSRCDLYVLHNLARDSHCRRINWRSFKVYSMKNKIHTKLKHKKESPAGGRERERKEKKRKKAEKSVHGLHAINHFWYCNICTYLLTAVLFSEIPFSKVDGRKMKNSLKYTVVAFNCMLLIKIKITFKWTPSVWIIMVENSYSHRTEL